MFVRGGYVFPGGTLDIAGYVGSSWSSVGRSSSLAYNLYFDSGYVDPSGVNGRYLGQSVRCVALGG